MTTETFLTARRRLLGLSAADVAAATGVDEGAWLAFEQGSPGSGQLPVDGHGRLSDPQMWTDVCRVLRLAGCDLDVASELPAAMAGVAPTVKPGSDGGPAAAAFNDGFRPGLLAPRVAWLVAELAELTGNPERWHDPTVPLWVRDRLPVSLQADRTAEVVRERAAAVAGELRAGRLPWPETIVDQLLWSLLLDLADDVWPWAQAAPEIAALDGYGMYDDPAWARRMLLGDDRYLDVYDEVDVDPAVLLG